MSKQPERWVKDCVIKIIDSAKLEGIPICYHMPIGSGYGKPALDFAVCIRGMYYEVETKALDEIPTYRQQLRIAEVKEAGGNVIVVNNMMTLNLFHRAVFGRGMSDKERLDFLKLMERGIHADKREKQSRTTGTAESRAGAKVLTEGKTPKPSRTPRSRRTTSA